MGLIDLLSCLGRRNSAMRTDSDTLQLMKDFGLHLLYDGTKPRADQSLREVEEDDQPCLEEVDIIAVHGLQGHAINNWTHEPSHMMWLQTLLPVAMPMSRIMSYGYDAKIYNSKSTLHIMDNAEDMLSLIQGKRTLPKLRSRRIIFIGHSMGGIVIKKALSMAREAKQYEGLLESTAGIMFMGTPHDGADGAKLVHTAAEIARSLLNQEVNSILLKTLERDSAQLRDISRSFGYLNKIKIVTVIESDKTNIPYLGTRRLIVSHTSASLNLGDRETVLTIMGADHHMVCKFCGEDDMGYHKIRLAIIDLAASTVVSKSSDLEKVRKRLHSIDESISQGSGKLQKMLNEGIQGTKSSLAALEINSNTQYNNELREKMLKILSPLTNPIKKRIESTPETGLAFLQKKEYREWKKCPASFLWLNGKSGTGKTVLFSTITEDISAYCGSGTTNSAAASVYCSWDDQDVASLISTLLSDFIRKMRRVPQQTADLIKKCEGSTFKEADLSDALRCLLPHLDSAYIMIDGLDEWPLENSRRRSLLKWIARLDGWKFPHLHVLLTSQYLPDIRDFLSDKCALRIESRPDILIHVKHELHTDDQLAKLDDSLKAEIEGLLIADSDEGFRWVALQLMEFKDCSSPEQIHKALRTLPQTLEETYDRILGSVHQRNRRCVRAALQWIACSARPLSLDELAVAAVIDPAVSKPNRFENQLVGGGEAIHKMLSKLIDVHEVERVSLFDFVHREPKSTSISDVTNDIERVLKELEYPGPNIVKFSHSSVRDYLLQRRDDPNVSRSFTFSEDLAHRFIAKSCLAYIQDIFETLRLGDKAYGVGDEFFLQYLARHWHTHAARLPDKEPGSLAHLLNEVPAAVGFLLMADDEHTEESFGDLVGYKRKTGAPTPGQMLQYAACSGASCVVDIILASNPDLDVNASTETGATALSFACERKSWQIADTLLKHGSDPNKHDEMTTLLFSASMYGADDILQELISHGANVNVHCGMSDEDTPLTAAIAACHPNTVELLLNNGADPYLISSLGIPASVAARYGRYECLDLLLKRGASLIRPDSDSPSPLEYASASGSVEIVRLLLAHGMDVDGCLMRLDEDKMAPANTYRFKYPFVERKFRPKPDYTPGFHWESYGSPMHAAAANGYTEVIRILIENNAAVNERSHYWETPSTLAKLRGHEETLEYLASKGGVVSKHASLYHRQDLFKTCNGSNEWFFEDNEK